VAVLPEDRKRIEKDRRGKERGGSAWVREELLDLAPMGLIVLHGERDELMEAGRAEIGVGARPLPLIITKPAQLFDALSP
jgi:hypothetical protein